MTRTWVTTASPNVEAMVNSLTAACDRGFVPDEIHALSLPSVEAEVKEALASGERTIEAYGGHTPGEKRTEIGGETEFDKIRDHVQSAVEGADDGDEVAVDEVGRGVEYVDVGEDRAFEHRELLFADDGERPPSAV